MRDHMARQFLVCHARAIRQILQKNAGVLGIYSTGCYSYPAAQDFGPNVLHWLWDSLG